MSRRWLCDLLVSLAGALLATTGGVLAQSPAQNWPNKPVRISVPVPPGGAIDLVCRTVFEQVSRQLSQPFVIDNRGGGGRRYQAELKEARPQQWCDSCSIA